VEHAANASFLVAQIENVDATAVRYHAVDGRFLPAAGGRLRLGSDSGRSGQQHDVYAGHIHAGCSAMAFALVRPSVNNLHQLAAASHAVP